MSVAIATLRVLNVVGRSRGTAAVRIGRYVQRGHLLRQVEAPARAFSRRGSSDSKGPMPSRGEAPARAI